MKLVQRAAVAAAVLMFLASGVFAQSELPVERRAEPGAAVVAAAANLVYTPVRFAVSLVSAELGGLAGFLTGGNTSVAEDIWGAFEGPAILTRKSVSGEEPVTFGPYEYRLQLITPGY